MSKANSTISKIKASTKATVVSANPGDESAEVHSAASTSTLLNRLQRFSLLLPVTLALLFSVNTLWLDYASDDQQQVLNNAGIKDLRNLPLAFTSTVWGFVNLDTATTAQPYYRPMFNVWSMLNYALFARHIWGWHLMNVLIHMLATWLVFVVCREFTERKTLALTAACLFAVHPVHTESVAWISGVTDPLMSVFMLSSFYFYLRLRKSGSPGHLAGMLATYLLALWSKETALAFPLVIAYLELVHFNQSVPWKARLTASGRLIGALLVPIVIFFLMRRATLGAFFLLEELRYPLSFALLTIPLALLKYLALTLVPYGYSYQHYTDLITTAASLGFLVPVAVLILLGLLIAFRGSRLLQFAGVWFVAFLLPSLAAIRSFDPEYVVQERYLYLPSLGFCLALGLAIEWLATRKFFAKYQGAALALTAMLVLVLGLSQIRQSLFWQDTLSVFQRCVAVAPNSANAYASLANAYFLMGRPREAEAAAQTGLRLDPKCNNAYLNLSYLSKQSGKLDQAIDYLEQAKSNIPVTPITRTGLATTILNLGMLYAEKKDLERAEENFQQSIALWDRANGYYNFGQYLITQNRFEEALPYFEKTVKLLPPGTALIHLSLGSIYEKLKQPDRAVAEYNKYLENASPKASGRQEVSQRITQIRAAGKK